MRARALMYQVKGRLARLYRAFPSSFFAEFTRFDLKCGQRVFTSGVAYIKCATGLISEVVRIANEINLRGFKSAGYNTRYVVRKVRWCLTAWASCDAPVTHGAHSPFPTPTPPLSTSKMCEVFMPESGTKKELGLFWVDVFVSALRRVSPDQGGYVGWCEGQGCSTAVELMEMHEWACSAHLISMFACIFKAAVKAKVSSAAKLDRAAFVSAQELFKSEQDGLQPNHALVLRSLKGWAAAVKPLVQESDAAKWTYADNDDGGD